MRGPAIHFILTRSLRVLVEDLEDAAQAHQYLPAENRLGNA